MKPIPTTKELAEEALRILERQEATMTSKEHFERMVRDGLIDRQGRVLCNRLFGDSPKQPEAPPKRPRKRKRKRS